MMGMVARATGTMMVMMVTIIAVVFLKKGPGIDESWKPESGVGGILESVSFLCLLFPERVVRRPLLGPTWPSASAIRLTAHLLDG